MFDKIKFIILMTIFGTVGLFVRNIDLEPGEISFYRCFIAMIIVSSVVFIKRRGSYRIPIRGNRVLLLVSGTVLGLNWMFLFAAYQYTSIFNAILCYYMAPIFVMLFSPIVLKEKIDKFKYIFICLALTGMGFLVGENFTHFDSRNLIGIAFGVLSAIFYATLVILIKLIKNMKSMESTMFQFISAVITMFPYIYITYGIRIFQMTSRSAIYLLLLGVLHTGICYISYFALLQRLKSDVIAIYCYIDPFVSIVLSVSLLKDKLNLLQVVGGILILGSTFLSEMTERKKTNY